LSALALPLAVSLAFMVPGMWAGEAGTQPLSTAAAAWQVAWESMSTPCCSQRPTKHQHGRGPSHAAADVL